MYLTRRACVRVRRRRTRGGESAGTAPRALCPSTSLPGEPRGDEQSKRRALTLLSDGCQRLIDERAKGGLIVDGHLGQNLAIYPDVGLADSMHQYAVAHAAHASSGIDARNPEPAHIALAIPAVTIHIGHRAHDRFMRGAEKAAACAPMALCHLEYLLMLLVSGNTAFYSWHSSC